MSDNINLKELASEYGLELVDSIADNMLDSSLVANVPVEWARSNALLPVRISGEVCVLTSDPSKIEQQDYLALLIGSEMRPVLADNALINQSIESCYYSKENSPKEFLRDMDASDKEESIQPSKRSSDLLQIPEKAPVTQLVNLILLEAVKRKASDIHFEPFESRLRVRYRIDGILYEQAAPPKQMEEALVSRIKVMARMDIAEKRLPQDGMARVRVGEREIDIRVSTVPIAEGERVVLRLLDQNSALLPLPVLGMVESTLDSFEHLVKEPNGIIVVSGPTGSGKTTTLYAALCQLDSSRRNIMTIEDPIEYQLPDIGQIQIKPKIGLTFSNGLRHILRQDPDVVLVGETRDLETAEIAMRASLTGHLVFTTLHTNDAPSAILRFIDMGVEPYLLASCLKGVLAQRLVRKLCVECREEYVVSKSDFSSLDDTVKALDGKKAWRAAGCDKCLEGYSGRLGVFELMVSDSKIEGLIRSGKADSEQLRKAAREKGMRDLLSDGVAKVLDGTTSLDEIINVIG